MILRKEGIVKERIVNLQINSYISLTLCLKSIVKGMWISFDKQFSIYEFEFSFFSNESNNCNDDSTKNKNNRVQNILI